MKLNNSKSCENSENLFIFFKIVCKIPEKQLNDTQFKLNKFILFNFIISSKVIF